jgi:two-component system, cell cycle response regulator DivK
MAQVHALVIDDNVKNVNILAYLLSEQGVDSTRVTNPKQLDTILDGIGKVDVVFLDLEMPGVNGYEVLGQLKVATDFQAVPVVAYTVHVSEINAAHDQGFDSFIGKPLDPDRFPDQLARILRGEPVWETV